MKTVAFIPLRGGSKSIPLKNIRPFCGKPLAYWVTKAALDTPTIDEVFISTDSDSIKDTMTKEFSHKLQVIGRDASTATDEASTESVMLEFAEKYEFDYIILAQATSPLLSSNDLTAGIEKYFKNKYDSLLSVVRQKRFIWEESEGVVKSINYNPSKRPRRQDMSGYFVENGAFYITSRRNLLNSKCRLSGRTGLYEMDERTYFEIDEPSDWEIMEMLKKQTIS